MVLISKCHFSVLDKSEITENAEELREYREVHKEIDLSVLSSALCTP